MQAPGPRLPELQSQSPVAGIIELAQRARSEGLIQSCRCLSTASVKQPCRFWYLELARPIGGRSAVTLSDQKALTWLEALLLGAELYSTGRGHQTVARRLERILTPFSCKNRQQLSDLLWQEYGLAVSAADLSPVLQRLIAERKVEELDGTYRATRAVVHDL